MINSCYKISLDIQDHSSNVLLRAKKGDTGRTLFITLTDGRNPYAISEECRAVFTAKKADGKTLFNECSIIDHVIVYEFTPQTTSVAGKAACEIKLYGADEKLLTSAHFTLMVDDTVYNEGDEVESSQEVTALTALVSETIELIKDVEDKVESGAFMGKPGDTPYIGENGNWWVGETDTGVSAGGSANFAYNFTTVCKTPEVSDVSGMPIYDIYRNPQDAQAIDYIVRNWGKEPMSIYIQGYPVIGVDINNHHLKVLYNDRYIYTFNWWVEAALQRLSLWAHAVVEIAYKGELDEELYNRDKRAENIDGIVTMPTFRKGALFVQDGTLLYDPYHSAVCTPENVFIHMNKGDILHVKDAFNYDCLIIYMVDGAYVEDEIALLEPDENGGTSVDYIAPVAGDYAITIYPLTAYGRLGTYKDAPSQISITKSSGFLAKEVELIRNRDYIVEQGRSSNGWDYRKWASGVAECWKTVTSTVKTTDWKDSGMMSFLSYGLFWTKDIKIQLPYPFTFASRPVETACMTNGTVWFPLSLISTTGKQTDKTDSYRICTYKTPNQDIEVTIAFHVVGKWK